MSGYLQGCNEDQLKSIYSEFNVTEDTLRRDVQILIDWFKKQPHLPNIDDEEFLMNVLLNCKNSIEKSKQRLDTYYTLKSVYPKFFTNRDPYGSEFDRIIHTGLFLPLPKLTPEGYQIWVFRILDPVKGNSLTIEDIWKIYFLNVEITLKNEVHRKIITIFDHENLSIATATAVTHGALKVAQIFPGLSVLRFHKTYIVHFNTALSTLIGLSKKMMKKKIADRIEIVENSNLFDVLPKDVLPSNYGGNEKSLEELAELYHTYIKENKDWLISQENLHADMSKRTDDRYADLSSLHGVNGSFRELHVD